MIIETSVQSIGCFVLMKEIVLIDRIQKNRMIIGNMKMKMVSVLVFPSNRPEFDIFFNGFQ